MALSDANKARSNAKTVANDSGPSGHLQAQLGLFASRELGKTSSRYFAPGDGRSSSVPDDIATAGTWADSVSLSALCQASQIELRIWGYNLLALSKECGNMIPAWAIVNILALFRLWG